MSKHLGGACPSLGLPFTGPTLPRAALPRACSSSGRPSLVRPSSGRNSTGLPFVGLPFHGPTFPGPPFPGAALRQPSIPGNGSSLPRIFSSPVQLLANCSRPFAGLPFFWVVFFRSGLPHGIPVPDLCTTGNPSSHLPSWGPPSTVVTNARRFGDSGLAKSWRVTFLRCSL